MKPKTQRGFLFSATPLSWHQDPSDLKVRPNKTPCKRCGARLVGEEAKEYLLCGKCKRLDDKWLRLINKK